MNLFESVVIFTVIIMIMRYSLCAYVASHCCFSHTKDK